jgi:hypothetical protein
VSCSGGTAVSVGEGEGGGVGGVGGGEGGGGAEYLPSYFPRNLKTPQLPASPPDSSSMGPDGPASAPHPAGTSQDVVPVMVL